MNFDDVVLNALHSLGMNILSSEASVISFGAVGDPTWIFTHHGEVVLQKNDSLYVFLHALGDPELSDAGLGYLIRQVLVAGVDGRSEPEVRAFVLGVYEEMRQNSDGFFRQTPDSPKRRLFLAKSAALRKSSFPDR